MTFTTRTATVSQHPVKSIMNGVGCSSSTECQEAMGRQADVRSCTVTVDGRADLTCTALALEREGMSIQKVEGIAVDPKWEPPIDFHCMWDAMELGSCMPGFVVSAPHRFWRRIPTRLEDECKQALAHPHHSTAIMEAAKNVKGETWYG